MTARADASSQIIAANFEVAEVGGLPIARITRPQTAALLIDLATNQRRGDRPWFATSANGHVVSMCRVDPDFMRLMQRADIINPDGMPLVFASKIKTSLPLPERVSTTDLVHDVAIAAKGKDVRMFFLGATEEENALAVARIRNLYPHVDIVGHMSGYHTEEAWPARVAEINALRPDIVWVALGVPMEQRFVERYSEMMPDVGLIKTSGGLFNFLSGSAPRAPMWMQRSSLEWLHRVWLEPRRLFWRHFVTSPHAVWVLLTTPVRHLHKTLYKP